MRVRKLRDGDLLEVGDRIKVEHRGIGGTHWETVVRVSKAYAFVRYNEHAEGKYRREYKDLYFEPLPRSAWKTTNYSAWRPVEQVEARG